MSNGGEHIERLGACPLCDSPRIRIRRQRHRRLLWRCRACNGVFETPRVAEYTIPPGDDGRSYVFAESIPQMEQRARLRGPSQRVSTRPVESTPKPQAGRHTPASTRPVESTPKPQAGRHTPASTRPVESTLKTREGRHGRRNPVSARLIAAIAVVIVVGVVGYLVFISGPGRGGSGSDQPPTSDESAAVVVPLSPIPEPAASTSTPQPPITPTPQPPSAPTPTGTALLAANAGRKVAE